MRCGKKKTQGMQEGLALLEMLHSHPSMDASFFQPLNLLEECDLYVKN
jgi:hypothetical protein